MKIHVLGIPHTSTTEEFTTCAFTMKVFNLCRMMTRRGHEVIHYGTEGSDPECTEHVDVVSLADRERVYPHPGTGFYNHDRADRDALLYKMGWASRCKAELAKRTGERNTEIVCLTWGDAQRMAVDGMPQFLVESGIGYPNSWADWRVYESYAWLHMHMGRDGLFGGERWYWSVIPNAFDTKNFEFNAKRGEDFLYLGRLHRNKGLFDAIRAAKECGRKITIVGQGDPAPYLEGNPHASYLPPVGVEGRRKLLSEARAVFCNTYFVEPFCGVAVEAQMSGAPVLTTDWGAFSETVLHGKTGYRCRTFEQLVWAAENVDRIDPAECARWARDNYSLERVALMYEEYFQQVLNLRTNSTSNGSKTEGLYLLHPGRRELDWLRKRYDASEPAIDLERVHTAPEPAVTVDAAVEWAEAQDWERGWWGLSRGPHWDDEERKQEVYARLMGFPTGKDFGGKTILDVGCGPISMLQRSKHGPSRGVDPLAVSDETRARYESSGVEFLNMQAEDMPTDREFDEVWMYNCFSGDTRFWANGQLVRLADAVGEEVEVLAGDGQWRPATVTSFGKQKLQRVVFFPYRAPTTVTYEYDVTPNHRWITTNRGEVTDLRIGDRVLATPVAHENDAVFRDGFVHGLVFGDGHRLLNKRGLAREGRFAIRLCGEKAAHLTTIKASTFFAGDTSPPSYNGDPAVWLNAPADLKRLPEAETSLRYQAGFVAGWMAAGGSSKKKEGSPSLVLWSTNVDALDWVAERAPLLGWCVTGRTVGSNMETNFGPRSAPVHSLTLRAEPTEYRVRAIVDEGREEEVFCVVEPDTHAFTLEGGLITGNCLQHTEDPKTILAKMMKLGRAVRIFEWIDIAEKHAGHPQLLTEALFLAAFGGDEYERPIWNVGTLRDLDGGVTKYIAIHAVKKAVAVEAQMAAQ
jgi:glycosyltransferase involved in cell wall biosynthesis